MSNGHGEDLNACEILKQFKSRYPSAEISAMPMVGEGNAYRNLGIPIIAPTRHLPSGGFVYMDRAKLFADVQAGLPSLVGQQLQAIRAYSRNCDLIFATGDVVVLLAAGITGRPYASFLVSSSAYYEGKLTLPLLAKLLLRSPRCRQIFTRDRFTAELMQTKGFSTTVFAGYPIMDVLAPTGKDLDLAPNSPTIALLPGSRLPEASHNLAILLDLAIEIQREFTAVPVQFRAAVVPKMMEIGVNGKTPLEEVATQQGWHCWSNGKLYHDRSNIAIICYCDAFADILQRCDLAIGMAGTAIEQAVGLGKPVIQIPGGGPQFTYRFAEAQMRLLGKSVKTVGKQTANPQTLIEAARLTQQTLADKAYLEECQQNGIERVGKPGGSAQIADRLAALLWGNTLLRQ
ncbi:lipid-A-disaccharide synthase-related protein [Pseudanabaena sp. PCC 6802]|uniref:lipid-A-disaccharide synthase-related protein n=1 Tax=Pseudanabaena sp. PCC 6802 TaxID=118173 RepID=UPI000363BB11